VKVLDRVLWALGLVGILAALYLVFMWVPTADVREGIAQRIFYFHVPMAWISFLAFSLTFLGSIFYLVRGGKGWDNLAYSGAEIGVLFAFLNIATGSIWARPAWGHWWVWDPRLTSMMVLWLIYIGYLLLRSYTPAHQAPRFAAVVGIAGFLDVPIVYLAIRLWRTLHPGPVIGTGGGLHPTMLTTFLFSLAAFTLFFILLARLRVALRGAEAEIEELKEAWRE